MNTIVIDHFIEKKREGTYYSVPFEMPEGMESFTLRYRYSREGNPKNVVDLGLSDGKGRFLGWSGGARSSITLGPYSATPGYRMTKLEKGTWQILVGAYRIPEEGLSVRYELSFSPSHRRWLRGDLHMHSTASDGENDTHTLAKRAVKEGLDFIAIADHNNYCENFQLPVIPGLTVIPAVEWTHYKGHINFFGVKAPFDNSFVANSREEMLALLESVRENGALISVNHPKDPTCPYLWEDDRCFHMMELWNGPMRPANLAAEKWWRELLCQGRRIPIVGGSDFHRDKSPVRFAHPTTWVYADSPALEDICAALAKGRSYLSASPRGVRLGIGSDACFGDVLPREEGRSWRFTAERGCPGMVLRLMTQEGIAAETRFGLKGSARMTLREGTWDFAYLVAGYPLREGLFIRAISNPIYFDETNKE